MSDILLTKHKLRAILKEGESINGSWSDRQLACLGVQDLPGGKSSGWPNRLEGLTISQADAERFLYLRDDHLMDRPSLKKQIANRRAVDFSVVSSNIPKQVTTQPHLQPSQQIVEECSQVFIVREVGSNRIGGVYKKLDAAQTRADRLAEAKESEYTVVTFDLR